MSVRNNLLKAIDASAGAVLCQLLRVSSRAVNHVEQYPAIDRNLVKRVLLVRPGGMGDMVMLWPVIRLLKSSFPEAEIDIVCEKRNTDVLKIAGFDGVSMVYDSNPFSFLRQLLSRKYDVAIDTEQFHHFSAVFGFLSGAPVRIGFKINPRRNPLYTHLVNYSLEGYEGDQFMRLISAVADSSSDYRLMGSIEGKELESRSAIREDLVALGHYMVVQPGASSRYKLWAASKYIDVFSSLMDSRAMGLVLVGDGDDAAACSEILDGMPERLRSKCLSLAGKTGLVESAAVINGSDVFIGSDSGLSHLAAAMSVPTVILFGPSDYRKWGRQDGEHSVVHKDMPCSPCFIFGYNKPCESIACMKQISSKDVIEAVDSVLKS